MLVTINGIGNPKIQYKDHSNIKFDSLDEYLLLAKKCISKFGGGLSKKMLKDVADRGYGAIVRYLLSEGRTISQEALGNAVENVASKLLDEEENREVA